MEGFLCSNLEWKSLVEIAVEGIFIKCFCGFQEKSIVQLRGRSFYSEYDIEMRLRSQFKDYKVIIMNINRHGCNFPLKLRLNMIHQYHNSIID
jgi:hypothetical protein